MIERDLLDFHIMIRDYIFKRMSEKISLGRLNLKLEFDSSITGILTFNKLFDGEQAFEMDKTNGIHGIIELSDSLIRKILLINYDDLKELLQENNSF